MYVYCVRDDFVGDDCWPCLGFMNLSHTVTLPGIGTYASCQFLCCVLLVISIMYCPLPNTYFAGLVGDHLCGFVG